MEAKTERVSIREACQLLGMNQNAVHERMRRGMLPIGHAYSPKENGTTRWRFVILRPMLNRYLGYGEEGGNSYVSRIRKGTSSYR